MSEVVEIGMPLEEIRRRIMNGEKFYHGVSNPDDGKIGQLLTVEEIDEWLKGMKTK